MSKKPRVRRVSVAMPAPAAPANWLRGIRFSGFTVMTLGMIVLFIVVLAPSLRVYVEQQQEQAALAAQVEAQARERLYYVKPGEFSYLVIDDGATPVGTDGVPISDEVQTTQVDWVSQMLSSILTAGLTDAVPAELEAPVIQGAPQ